MDVLWGGALRNQMLTGTNVSLMNAIPVLMYLPFYLRINSYY